MSDHSCSITCVPPSTTYCGQVHSKMRRETTSQIRLLHWPKKALGLAECHTREALLLSLLVGEHSVSQACLQESP